MYKDVIFKIRARFEKPQSILLEYLMAFYNESFMPVRWIIRVINFTERNVRLKEC